MQHGNLVFSLRINRLKDRLHGGCVVDDSSTEDRGQCQVYTRRGCHLCDDAAELLKRYGLSPELIDIDADETLRHQFDTCVPVVVIDGKIRFRGRVNEVLLRRILMGRAQ